MKRDNLHFSSREIDGYNKPFAFIISEREAGKTTDILCKIYQYFKDYGRTTIVIRRQINDITESYIEDLAKPINKFIDNPEDKLKFDFRKGALKEGIVTLKVNGVDFIRVIALSNPVSRLKSQMLPNLKFIVFDEFICNPKFGEKYLKDEAFKFNELYNTYQRESPDLKCYFLGNPYSLYNPYFSFNNVDTKKLKPNVILYDKTWVVQCYQITEELKAAILKRNPLYQFDNAYKKYAFDGLAINDMNIQLGTLEQNYYMRWVFKIDNKFIGVFKDDTCSKPIKYHCQFINDYSRRRTAICFDFQELENRTALLAPDDRVRFWQFKDAMRRREITFESIEVYYLIEEIFINL